MNTQRQVFEKLAKQKLGVIEDAVNEQKADFYERVGKLKQFMDDMAGADRDLTEALDAMEPLKQNFLSLYNDLSEQISEYEGLWQVAEELENYGVDAGPDWMMIDDLFGDVVQYSNETKSKIG